MMAISKQLIELATTTAERMLQEGKNVGRIEPTDFYVLSSEQGFNGYTPIHKIEVGGKRFVIAWKTF